MPDGPKGVLRRFYEAVSAGNLDALDELMSDDMVEHEQMPGLEPTKEGVKQFFALYRSAPTASCGAPPRSCRRLGGTVT